MEQDYHTRTSAYKHKKDVIFQLVFFLLVGINHMILSLPKKKINNNNELLLLIILGSTKNISFQILDPLSVLFSL